MAPDPDTLRAAHGAAAIDDCGFDTLYSTNVQRAARRFWTPVAVARRVAAWLDALSVRRVLDVGSGSGKFCIIAAQAAPTIHFTGVEQRPHLVAEAASVAAALDICNVDFVVGDATRVELDAFNAVYFFNPFAENIYVPEEIFDASVELSDSRFVDDVLRTEHALSTARKGLLLVTYFGFGGRVPGGYDLLHSEHCTWDWLKFWRKERDEAEGMVLVEGRAERGPISSSDAGSGR